jgi:aspartyl-tRNA(Asn)/glutamyl-tRNA(Gln) amidotransferase subunit A
MRALLDDLTLTSAAERIRTGELSALDVIEAVLDRIQALNDRMNVFIRVESAASLKAVLVGETTEGALCGLPVSLKDLIDTRGSPTTAGSPVFKGRRAMRDAVVASKLRAAGATLIGKTNLHECAFGVTGVNPHFGPSRNPWDPERISGGSSGGSAVSVMLGMGLGSIGTDTGGSIRIPAALCGAVGFKPTYGLVSTLGVTPLAPSFDHVGPITRTVRDAALLLNAIAEPDQDFSSDLDGGVRGLRFGLSPVTFERLDPEVGALTRAATRTIQELGGVLVDVELPGPRENEEVFKAIAGSEALAYHEPYLKQSPELYSVETRERIEAASAVRGADYVRAQEKRQEMRERLRDVLETCDLLVSPTVPIPAPLIRAKSVEIEGVSESLLGVLTRNTRLFSTLGMPSISVPCGFTSNDLPVGLQIAGWGLSDRLVLRAANAYEQATEWFLRRPRIQDAG